ncbi:class I SAM-dependent methyltransferase [Jeotgalibacillus soli]|uniref:Methyltransferase domain-containing protein n=1 Tax=Jeotgalibacillus soli TaxID=889306 RepID=A0A0C2RPB1_9BACL|nr:class I SAM-dependent methyltransferase [Jeotgalibacillus soli]KIL52085.1 hypothetical protein KP78_04550 [Jeotgalibacillus soli]
MKVPFFHQFSRPKGILGRFAGAIMSLENRKLNVWTIGCLDLVANDRVLEIGYGPGFAMKRMLEGHKNLYVDGIDSSEVMFNQAANRIKPFIQSGRARVIQGKVEHLYLPLSHYDKILSVNNYTIWGNRKHALSCLYGALKEGGRIAITIQPREDTASPTMTKMMASDLYHSLEEAGFTRVSISYRRIFPELAVCAVGFK